MIRQEELRHIHFHEIDLSRGSAAHVWQHWSLHERVQVSDRGKWMRNMLRAPDAHVYICGDSLMANAVTASLTQIMGEGTSPRLQLVL